MMSTMSVELLIVMIVFYEVLTGIYILIPLLKVRGVANINVL
jgi:hypothetical protein